MNVLLSQYGKTVLYAIIALVIIIPIVTLSVTSMKDFTPNQREDTNRDNSYLLEYEAPTITVSKTNLKISADATNVDLKSLFDVKATVNNGQTPVDSMYINYDTDFCEGKKGIYKIAFKCTYTYKSKEGYDIPRESIKEVKLVVE